MDTLVKLTTLLLAILAGLFVVEFMVGNKQVEFASVCFQQSVLSSTKCFQIEVANTPAEQEKGLMNRTHLDQNKGMLFVFNREDEYSFWMKNTLIPLDMIWINQNNQVVYIEQNAQPCGQGDCPNIDPHVNAKYVLEVNGGTAQEFDIKAGDRVSF